MRIGPYTKVLLMFANRKLKTKKLFTGVLLVILLFDYAYNQCWGKLLLKVMYCNIALLPKKVTHYVT